VRSLRPHGSWRILSRKQGEALEHDTVNGAAVAHRNALAGKPDAVTVEIEAAMLADGKLFGLNPYDPLTISLSAVALTAVAILASYLPARRAARLDPMAALRDE
jgi:hypothetical protein